MALRPSSQTGLLSAAFVFTRDFPDESYGLLATVAQRAGAGEFGTDSRAGDEGGAGLAGSGSTRRANSLRPLASMARQRPNIGSRAIREVHARFREHLGVKFPRATRQNRTNGGIAGEVRTWAVKQTKSARKRTWGLNVGCC